jgi:hypothetical protein
VGEVFARDRLRVFAEILWVSTGDKVPALLASSGAKIDKIIARAHHCFIVFDNQNCIALLLQVTECVDQTLVISRMKTN